MVNYLANRVSAHGWMPQQALTDPSRGLGVLLRQSRGNYICCPENIDEQLLSAAQRLNVGVLITLRLNMLYPIIAGMSDGQTELLMKGGSQLQVLESLSAVSSNSVKKYQYAAILRKESLLLVWQDEINNILTHAQKMEDKLLNYVWGRNSMLGYSPAMSPLTGVSPFHSTTASVSNFSVLAEKSGAIVNTPDEVSDNEEELNNEADEPLESINRPIMLHSAFFVGLGLCLAIVLVYGFAIGQLVSETFLDGNYTRLALIVVCPLLMFAGLFFFQVIFGDIWQMVGPIGGLSKNSRTYSCIKPNLRQAYSLGFEPPHITIQMPVYKEGMEGVIIPTVRSLQAAISYYESRGGKASIFVNDDGMRAISEEEAQIRRDFYHDNDIGWVARPKHGDDGYERKGKFKKASNMNFALNLSQQVEAYMQEMVEARAAEQLARNDSEPIMMEEDELEEIYEQCLERALRENPKAMASGNIRMGEIFLIVDSDTRVVSFFPCCSYGSFTNHNFSQPVDCLLYGAAEMFLSPEVAIVQHHIGVLQVTHDYWENAITFCSSISLLVTTLTNLYG